MRIWSGRLRAWCIGRKPLAPHTARLFERIMNDKPHPEMGYRGCLGIIRLGGQVLQRTRGSGGGTSVAHRRVPLQKRRIDLEELARPNATESLATARIHAPHDNIRGAEYFE